VHLSLAGNGMGDEGAKLLASALSNDLLPLLEELHLHGNTVGDKGLAALAGAMADRRVPHLRVLHLHDNRNIGAAGVKALSSALNIIKPVLEEVRKYVVISTAASS
jgi:Ran GTPase-activating protein (RanGAP) involved in mRNA processing and transport